MADSALSWKKIYGLNRNIIEQKVNRYFFVPEPVKIDIEGCPDEEIGVEIKRHLHPDFEERGERTFVFEKQVYIPKKDYKDGFVRLMDAVNIDIDGDDVKFHSNSFEEAREVRAKIIQWVSDDSIPAKVVMDDASIVEGLCEADCKDLEIGDVVQFERFGFARLDSIEDGEMIFYFAHK